MTDNSTDRAFGGSIPLLYETNLVPLIFEPYARDLARTLAARPLSNVLEVAAGTGVVTRALDALLPDHVAMTATDLNQSMLDQAATRSFDHDVKWQQADAMQLPFGDASFDAVVCQFGVMFFPERSKAYSEMLRVLRPGGRLVFNVWDRIEENEFAQAVSRALEQVFPADPPRFLERTPHGYHDHGLIARDLSQAGFSAVPEFRTMAARSRAASAQIAAIAYCQGTPLRNEIEARDSSRLIEATDRAAQEIARRFGSGEVDGKIQAHIVVVTC